MSTSYLTPQQKRQQKNRYRLRTGSNQYLRRTWSNREKELVLKHNQTDRELSSQIKRSVTAIQKMRCYLKQGKVNLNE